MKQYSSKNCYADPIAASAHAPKVARQQMRGLLLMIDLVNLVRACPAVAKRRRGR